MSTTPAVAATELAPFGPLWLRHAPHASAALLNPQAREAFGALAENAPEGAEAFALECGLAPNVRPHLYIAVQDARAKEAIGHGDVGGLLYLRYTLNNAGRASVPLPHRPGPSGRGDWPAWLASLRDRGLPAATAAQVQDWLASLPDTARIDNAAWLDRRPGQPLRLYVSGLPDGLPPGVPHATATLPDAAAVLAALAHRHVAIVDLDEKGTRPRWGLELLAARHPAGALARWAPMIDALAAHGFCTPEGAQGLAQWCGGDQRGISHMKLMLEDGRVRDARAFLLARRAAA